MLEMGGFHPCRWFSWFPLARLPELHQPSFVVVENVESTQQVIGVHYVETTFDECHPYEGIDE